MPRITPPPKRTDPIEEPQQPATPPPTPTKTPAGPWLEWQIAVEDAPAIEGMSYLRLIVTPGYSGALELASYSAPEHEEYPSLFIRAVTSAKAFTELVNKKHPVKLYIMVDENGNVIHNQEGQIVELVISEYDGKHIRGTFNGHVHDEDLGGDAPITGKFQAVVEE